MNIAAHPSILKATIFEHTNYGGQHQMLSIGRYNISDLNIGNDQLSSLKVPSGLQVTLYEHANFQGTSRTYTADTPFVQGFNDQTSSIVVEFSGVTIYQHANYHGPSQVLPAGKYDIHDLQIGNDQLSSLRVPPGWQITIYQNSGFSGSFRTYITDVPFVEDFNDQTSSIIVEQVGVTIYQDAHYQGKHQVLPVGKYDIHELQIGNDQISSLQIPSGLRVTLYQHAGFQGDFRSYITDVPFVHDFNDQTSSIVVERLGATIYQHANYQGTSQFLPVGKYNINDLKIGNDQLSSLRVPPGLQVTLYEHANFKGKSHTYTTDIPFVQEFNDQTSSIIVELLGATVYQHANYDGASQVLTVGKYNIQELQIGNDQLSSLRVPPGLKVTLYQHAGFQGATRTYTSDVAFVEDFNDQTSSITVEQLAVTIYQHANYQGASHVLPLGRYDMNELQIGNDQLSSLRVPDGLKVTLYQHSGFQGASRSYTSDVEFVRDFNDQTSSIVVELLTAATPEAPFTPQPSPPDGAPTGAPPDITPPSQDEQNAIRAEAKDKADIGNSLGQGYVSHPPDDIPGRPLSELIAEGVMPQYELMKRIESQVKDGVLTLDQSMLGEYGILVDLVGAIMDILTPIRNVKIKFAQGSPGIIGEPGREVKVKPDEDGNLATPEDHALKISGDVTLFGSKEAELKYADFFHYKGKPHCSFKFAFVDEMGIGEFLPGVPLLQGLKLSTPTIIATTASTLYDPSLDSGINEGFNFFGNLKIAESDDPGIRFIGDLLRVKEIAVHAAVDTSATIPEYIMEAAVQRDITIVEGKNFKLRFTRSDVGIAVKGKPPEPSIAMSNDLVVTLIEKGQENHLVFTGGVKVETESITGSFTMNGTGRSPEGALSGTVQSTGEWREPFGIPGIVIRQFAVQIGFTYLAPWVDNVGIHANMKIGDVDGSISILVDTNDPDQFVLAGSTDRITLIQIMSAMSPATFIAYQALPASIRHAMNKVVDIALEQVKVSIVPSATSIGGVHFRDEGVTIAGHLAVFGWQASMYLNVDTFDGITAAADMDPINILNVFKVTGAGNNPAPKMRLRIAATETPYLYISAKVEFLALAQELQVEVGEDSMIFIFRRSLGSILTTNLTFSYKDYHFDAKGTIDFNLNASLDTPFGRITLVDVGFNAKTIIRSGETAGFYASISGDFQFYGKSITFPTLTLHAAPSDFRALYASVIQRVEDEALDLFGGVFETLGEWTNAVKDGAIVATKEVAEVAKDVYHASKEAAASAYRTLNKGANEAAQGIAHAYHISAKETAKVLEEAEYTANEVADAMENTFNLTVDGAAEALRYAGYGVDEVGGALKSAYNASAEVTAKALKYAGYGVSEVGNFMKDAYHLTGKGLESVLKDAGYAAGEVEGFLKDVGEWIEENLDPTKW